MVKRGPLSRTPPPHKFYYLKISKYSLTVSAGRIQHKIWISLPGRICWEEIYSIYWSYYHFLIIPYKKSFTSNLSKPSLSTLRAQPSAFKHLFSIIEANRFGCWFLSWSTLKRFSHEIDLGSWKLLFFTFVTSWHITADWFAGSRQDLSFHPCFGKS